MKPNGGKQRCDKCSKPLPGGNSRCSYCKGSFAGKSSGKDGGLARRESFFRDSEASHKSSDMFGSMFSGLMGSNDRSGESSRHRKAKSSFWDSDDDSHQSRDMFGGMFGGLTGSKGRDRSSGESSRRNRKARPSLWDSDDDSHQSRDMFGGMFGGLMGSKDRDRRSGESSRHRKAKSSFWDSDSDDDSHQSRGLFGGLMGSKDRDRRSGESSRHNRMARPSLWDSDDDSHRSHDMFGGMFGGLMGSKDRDRRSGESSRHNRKARPSLWDSDDDSHQLPDMFGSMFGGLMGSSSGETSRHRMNVPLLRDPGPSHQVPDMFGGMLGGLMGSNGPERRFTEPSRNHDVRRNSSSSEHNWDPFSIFRGSTSRQIDSGDYSVSREQEEQIQQRSMNDSRAPPPASGVSVKSLPKIKITKEHLKKDLQCAVCQENFEFGSEGREMPCNHIYHEDCLGPWLRENNSCPVCRFELPPPRKPFWLRLLHCIGLDGCVGLD